MAKIAFTVPGQPIPQPRARITTRGKFAHAYTLKKHPITAYREAIRAAAIAAGARPHDELVELWIYAYYVRPTSHSTKQGLKKTAPKTPRADTDNLAKGIMDALTGTAYADDQQVDRLHATKKFAPKAGTMIVIAQEEPQA